MKPEEISHLANAIVGTKSGELNQKVDDALEAISLDLDRNHDAYVVLQLLTVLQAAIGNLDIRLIAIEEVIRNARSIKRD